MMAAAANIYSKPGMLPFLSLCSRYPGGPWAGLLQQSIKEKQNISFGIQRFVNDDDNDEAASSDSESKSKATSAFSPWQEDRRNIEKISNDNVNIDDEEEDDINVEDEDEVSPTTTTPIAPKKPSIFSVSSILSNNTPSSKDNSNNSSSEREKDEITPEVLASRPFFYPGLTLDMLTKGRPEIFPRNLPNPFAFGSLFPGMNPAFAAMKAMDSNRNLLASAPNPPNFPFPGLPSLSSPSPPTSSPTDLEMLRLRGLAAAAATSTAALAASNGNYSDQFRPLPLGKSNNTNSN